MPRLRPSFAHAVLAAVVCTALAGCGIPSSLDTSKDDRTGFTKTVTYVVEFFEQPCWESADDRRSMCVSMHENLAGAPSEISEPITGLSFEFGHRKTVDLIATQHRRDDNSEYWTYGLARVISDAQVEPGVTFTITYDNAAYALLPENRDDPLVPYGAPDYTCKDAQVCARLDTELRNLGDTGLGFVATFVTGLPETPCVLTAIDPLEY